MLGTAFLNEITAANEGIEPGPLLDQLRERFVKELKEEQEMKEGEMRLRDGMDISLVRVNLKTNEAQWAGAKNPLYLIRKNGNGAIDTDYKRHMERNGYDLYELGAYHQPIGYVEEPESFPTHRFQLKENDSLYMFSDGYPDQFGGPKGKKFKKKRFKRTLLDLQDKNMNEQKGQLGQTIEDWMAQNDEEQIDDICVLGIRIA
jgi:serine phosphatase RsbU (regulator of sigma subunit)